MIKHHDRECKHCGCLFDTGSIRKQKLGGKINECPDCVEELGIKDVVPYLAVQAGDGKMSSITLLKFDSNEDREGFSNMWKVNTGYYKGKSCQLGRGLVPTQGYNAQVVAEFRGNPNHKGKE